MEYLLGVAGMTLIVAGWISSLDRAPPLRLSLLYSAGSVLLAAYAASIGDPVFLVLNLAAAVFSAVNAWRAVKKREERGRG